MQDNLLRDHDDIGAPGQCFLECDKDGRITWMSDKARLRLGQPANLLEALPEEILPAARRFLETGRPREALAGLFRRPGCDAVPVCLSCLMNSGARVVLSLEFRERAADIAAPLDNELASIQNRVLENYFRLLRAQQGLDGRLRRNRRNAGAVLIAQLERERARLGRELHTGVGQALAGIALHLGLIGKQMVDAPADVRLYLDRIGLLAGQAREEVRSISQRLHPPEWQKLCLADALRNLWHNSGIPDRFQGSLNIALSVEPSPTVRVLLFRAAQEALSNAVSHANATAVSLSIELREGWLHLSVEDNGQGFDTTQAAAAGLGLRTIREQVAGLSGQFTISSGPGGTKLELSVPARPVDE